MIKNLTVKADRCVINEQRSLSGELGLLVIKYSTKRPYRFVEGQVINLTVCDRETGHQYLIPDCVVRIVLHGSIVLSVYPDLVQYKYVGKHSLSDFFKVGWSVQQLLSHGIAGMKQ